VAIDNARLYHRSVTQQHWGEATRDLVSALLAGGSEAEVLDDAVGRVLALTGAEGAFIAQPSGRDLVVVASAGPKAADVGDVLDDTETRGVLAAAPTEPDPAADHVVVPISVGGHQAMGVMVVRGLPAELGGTSAPLLDFAQRLAVGLTAARSQREQARIDLLEDRDRIARDMHDHVIQRLFATGMSLQSASRLTSEPTARERIETAVDEVDAVIKDIRHTIFALNRAPDARSLASEVTTICEGAFVSLGFAPSLTMRGSVAGVPEQIAADLLAVVREGLSNVARHAQASHVEVVIDVSDTVLVRVLDDGVGPPVDATRSGLDNLARRADSRGGHFELAAAACGGTVLEWQVPLSPGST
jgi:nitrate/nitrite-specific signal transduction histidine kinase